MASERIETGIVTVGGECVNYDIRIVDARSPGRQAQDAVQGKPAGDIMVVIPGHGQTVHGPKKLVLAAAQLSRSQIAWCIDPVPARGGDRIEAQAIAEIARERILHEHPGAGEPAAATVIGWSHGGGEGLRAAAADSGLFPRYLGLCPTGIVERRPLDLVAGFAREALRVVWASVRRLDWACLLDTVRLGLDLAAGMLLDLVRSRSFRRVIQDIRWAARRVTGRRFSYRGGVVLLFGAQDSVVRWQDAFPACERPEDIHLHLAAFGEENFPQAVTIEVQAIEGTHVAPESDATRFLATGLSLLDQLDGPAV